MHWWVLGFYLAGVSCAGLRNVTVINSITARHASQLVLSNNNRRRTKAESKRVDQGFNKQRQTIRLKCCDVLLTLQSLQQSPLLHMALWVRVHFLQQLAPLRAHSYGSERVFFFDVEIMHVRVRMTFWSSHLGLGSIKMYFDFYCFS